MVVNGGTLDGVRLLSPMTVRWAMADQIGTMRGVAHPGDGYSWNLFNPVRVADGGATFPGSVGDVFWGGITGPRYFFDPQGKARRAGVHAGTVATRGLPRGIARDGLRRDAVVERAEIAQASCGIREQPIRHPIAGSAPLHRAYLSRQIRYNFRQPIRPPLFPHFEVATLPANPDWSWP